LINFAANLGTNKDKRSYNTFDIKTFSRDQLEALYFQDWIAGKIIDIPVEDMIREWRSFNAPDIEDDQLKKISDLEDQLEVKDKISDALKWARLYGGSLILLGIDPKHGEMDIPLEIDKIGEGDLKYMHTLDRWDVTSQDINNINPELSNYRLPNFYGIYGIKDNRIHHSRIIRFDGLSLPYRLKRQNQYWGGSILVRIYEAILNSALTSNSTASLVHESKIDIIQVQNLFKHLASKEGEAALINRFMIADIMKSNNNTLILDSTETHNRTQFSFAGLPDLVTRFLNIVAAASDIPATRLLGSSATGLNASGEGDLKNYYNMIGNKQEKDLNSPLKKLDQILVRSAIGSYPEDLSFEFNPLWQLSDTERATIELQNAQRDQIYIDRGAITTDVVTKQLRKDGVYDNISDELIDAVKEMDDLKFEEGLNSGTTE
jgi:phage-related protein (TIGR01555 family)